MNNFCVSDEYDTNLPDSRSLNYQIINYIKDNLNIYLPMKGCSKKVMDDNKTYFESHNPDLMLLFNPSGFACGDFPSLMREFSEMLQCGRLRRFSILTFYDVMTKFFNIQQRWGI
jgi:hypothetical protein